MRGGGKPQSGRLFQFKKFLLLNGINSGCFQPHISQNVAKSMPSSTSQSCGDSLLAVSLSRQDGVIYSLPMHSQMSDRLKKEALVKQNPCTFGYITHMNCLSIVVSIRWWEKVNNEIVCKQCTFRQIWSHVHTV